METQLFASYPAEAPAVLVYVVTFSFKFVAGILQVPALDIVFFLSKNRLCNV